MICKRQEHSDGGVDRKTDRKSGNDHSTQASEAFESLSDLEGESAGSVDDDWNAFASTFSGNKQEWVYCSDTTVKAASLEEVLRYRNAYLIA